MTDLVQRLHDRVQPWKSGANIPDTIKDIEEAVDLLEALSHDNNQLRGVNAELVKAHTFATDPANSHWQGDVIRQQRARIEELEELLKSVRILRTKAQLQVEVSTQAIIQLQDALHAIYHLPPDQGEVPGAVLNIIQQVGMGS